jgi:hypothetical protein
MPLLNSKHQNRSGIYWSGIAAMVVVQIAVLVALSVGLLRYLEWSSDANQAEFLSYTKPLASDPNHPQRAVALVHPVSSPASCDRKARGTNP